MIDKELFVYVIDELKTVHDFTMGLNNYYKDNGAYGFIFQPDCSISVLRLLHNHFEEADKDEIIDYFCYGLNFGRDGGTIKDSAGNEIDISTPEKLYDYLTRNN